MIRTFLWTSSMIRALLYDLYIPLECKGAD